MTKAQSRNISYATFLKVWKGSINSSTQIDHQKWIKKLRLEEEVSALCPSILYLMDLQKMQYIYISKNILRMSGYAADEFLTKGVYFTFSLIHPDDKQEIVEKVHQGQLDFLKSLNAGEYKKYKFSYNYRFRRLNGQYAHAHKEDVILETDPEGNPLLLMGVATDITHLKKDTQINFSVTKYTEHVISSQSLYHTEIDFLSKRELEVLKLILTGVNTEEIAEKLCISPFTVKNHRRNILNKTGVKKMAEAISLAFEKGLLR